MPDSPVKGEYSEFADHPNIADPIGSFEDVILPCIDTNP